MRGASLQAICECMQSMWRAAPSGANQMKRNDEVQKKPPGQQDLPSGRPPGQPQSQDGALGPASTKFLSPSDEQRAQCIGTVHRTGTATASSWSTQSCEYNFPTQAMSHVDLHRLSDE
eukprot:1156166-Pelagomonas_calceolata.AAC.8